jgi:fatty-acyl-CoA synthase
MPPPPIIVAPGSAYQELLDEVEALAGWLQDNSVDKGDPVLLYMQNSLQYVIGYYAILRADAVVILINPMNRAAELEYCILDTDASVCLAGQELAYFITSLVDKTNLQQVVVAYGSYVRATTDLCPSPLKWRHHPRVRQRQVW